MTSRAGNACFHSTGSVATKQSSPQPCRLIWGIVQQRVYQSRVHNTDEQKQRLLHRLLHIWHGIDHIIDNAIDMPSRMCAGKRRTSVHEQLL